MPASAQEKAGLLLKRRLMRFINASPKRDRIHRAENSPPSSMSAGDRSGRKGGKGRRDVLPIHREGSGESHLARVAKALLGQSMDPAVISAIINVKLHLTRRRSSSLMSDKLAGRPVGHAILPPAMSCYAFANSATLVCRKTRRRRHYGHRSSFPGRKVIIDGSETTADRPFDNFESDWSLVCSLFYN